MKTFIIALAFIGVIGMISPVYGLNFLYEEEYKIQEIIDRCQEVIKHSDLSSVEKTAAKRNCVTQIHNHYVEFTNDHKYLAEWKSKVQDIQKCEDWYTQYVYLDYEQFKIKKNSDLVPYCVSLYENDLWNYDGFDKTSVLISALDAMKTNASFDESSKFNT